MRRIVMFLCGFSVVIAIALVLVAFVADYRRQHDATFMALERAQQLRTAPAHTQYAQALARNFPTYNGLPWWGLCYADDARTVEGLRQAIWLREETNSYWRQFDWPRATLIRANGQEQVHATYLVGKKIAWSRHKIPLREGEALVTDGQRTMRAQCCNEVAVSLPGEGVAMLRPVEEPPAAERDMGTYSDVGPGMPAPPGVILDGDSPLVSTRKTGYVPALVPSSLGYGGPVFIGGGGGGGASVSIGVPPSASAPLPTGTVAPIPEPGTIALFGIGCVGIVLYLFFRGGRG